MTLFKRLNQSPVLHVIEVTLLAVGVVAATFYACGANRIADESLQLNERLSSIEIRRADSEDERAAVRDFVVSYLASECSAKVTMIAFPLRRFYNLDGSAPGTDLSREYIEQRCEGEIEGIPPTYVLREVRIASPTAPGEYLVTADLVYDSGRDDAMHRMDGTTMMEMTLVKATTGPVKLVSDLRLAAIAEVVCSVDDGCT